MRPAEINKVFDLAVDVLTCCWGGLVAGMVCNKEIKSGLAKFYPSLVAFTSPKSPDFETANLHQDNYFQIVDNPERFKVIANALPSVVSVFAFESLRRSKEIYNLIKSKNEVRFLGHLRNAGAHGGRFNFYNLNKVFEDPKDLAWRNLIISKDLQDTAAFPDFFPQNAFASLFEDISKLLK